VFYYDDPKIYYSVDDFVSKIVLLTGIFFSDLCKPMFHHFKRETIQQGSDAASLVYLTVLLWHFKVQSS
jgi:hypothetical protein